MVLYQIADAAECVSADAIRGMNRRQRKKFVFIHQLQPRESVIAPQKIQGGFQEITVEIVASRNLVDAPPDQRARPVTGCDGAIVFNRSGLPPLAARFERLRMFEPANAVLRAPLKSGSKAGSAGPGVERGRLNAPA